ncbi:ABC transporter substrate-binding protein [Rhodococcus sp. NPDC055024]
MKKIMLALVSASLVLGITGCGSGSSLSGGGNSDPNTISIGSANFSESTLLAHIYSTALANAGFKTTVKPNIGSRELYIPALEDGSIDIIPEYTGALLAYVDPSATDIFTSDSIYSKLVTSIPDSLRILDKSGAEDKDTVVVTRDTAEKYGLRSLADLSDVAPRMVLGGPPETAERRAGVLGLRDLYSVEFKDFKAVDLGGPLTVSGLKSGNLDAAFMFTTQSAISENGFVALEDPKSMAVAENIVPLVRSDKLTPELQDVLNRVSAVLTTDSLIEMNRRVEVDKEEAARVAQDFVKENNL